MLEFAMEYLILIIKSKYLVLLITNIFFTTIFMQMIISVHDGELGWTNNYYLPDMYYLV